MEIELKPFADGLTCQIDILDCDLAAFPWRANTQSKRNNSRYVIRYWRVGGKKKEFAYMHRVIAERMGLDLSGGVVDHINGDTLDNRRENLRVVSRADSVRNQSGTSKANSSGTPGVSFAANRWCAGIGNGNKWVNLGRFKTKEEAVEARLKAERELWGIQPRRAWQHD
jgi:HNH endonuclease